MSKTKYMARITIEDCTDKINDRFILVALASQRAKDINSGSRVTIENNKFDKPTVIALREIAAGNISISALKEELLNRLRTKSRVEAIDDDPVDNINETSNEGFDFIPSGNDVYITDDYSDLEDQIFINSINEE